MSSAASSMSSCATTLLRYANLPPTLSQTCIETAGLSGSALGWRWAQLAPKNSCVSAGVKSRTLRTFIRDALRFISLKTQ